MLDKSQQFEKLMMHYLSENISDTDEQLLFDIINTDPKFKVKYNEMVKTRAISLIPVIESEKTSNHNNLLQLLKNGLSLNSQPKALHYFIRIAAIIIFVLSTSISIYYISTEFKSSSNTLMSYETVVPFGSQTKIVLPDGTIAWLNSGSTLKYNNLYGKKNREVVMTGEGYFDVKRDKNKPFLVHTNNIQIKVLGTVFNVRCYGNEQKVEVNLLEGRVNILVDKAGNSHSLDLKPGQKSIYNKSTKELLLLEADVNQSIAWTIGKLCFVDASFLDIVRELERRYDVKIDVSSSLLKNEIFTGSIDLNHQSVENVLNHIDAENKYTIEKNGKNISILSR